VNFYILRELKIVCAVNTTAETDYKLMEFFNYIRGECYD
jgi:hypothetical protein